MNRILVVRVGRAGDIVMITPALRAILEKHADAEIHMLTSADGRRVLRGFDTRITRLFLYERRGLAHWWRRRRLRAEIAATRYRYIYCFESNPSYRRLFARSHAEQYFLAPSDEVVPFPERCLRLVLDGWNGPRWVSLPVSAAGREAARRMFAAAGIDDSTIVVGLHPSFSHRRKLSLSALDARRRKTWPLASFARLATLLVEYASQRHLKLRVVCDLLPEERDLGLRLVQLSDGVVSLFTEPPDFERYKATIARMNLLVTPDTGPMHLAAALGTPVVALFAGRDPRDCGPYTDPAHYAVLRAEETERPEAGLAAISADVAFAAATTFLPPSGDWVSPAASRTA